jgi:hypothetical protein
VDAKHINRFILPWVLEIRKGADNSFAFPISLFAAQQKKNFLALIKEVRTEKSLCFIFLKKTNTINLPPVSSCFGFLFDLEAGGDIFFRNAWLSPKY